MQSHILYKRRITLGVLALGLFYLSLTSGIQVPTLASHSSLLSQQQSPFLPSVSSDGDSTVAAISRAPTLDGNLTSFEGEWDNAAEYSIPLGNTGVNGTLRFLTNSSLLYISFEYSLLNGSYSPINTTIPANETYNPQAHDFFVLEFDNNFDEIVGGTEESPDDLILADYMFERAVDAFSTGAQNESLSFDDFNHVNFAKNVTYNATLDSFHVVWEMSKPMDSKDLSGNDISVAPGLKLSFALHWFTNKSVVFELTNETTWYTVTMDRGAHPYLDLQPPENTTVLLIRGNSLHTHATNFTNLETFLTMYGYNVINPTIFEDVSLKQMLDADVILVVGGSDALSKGEDFNEAYNLFSALGGGTPVFLAVDAQAATSPLNKELQKWGIMVNPTRVSFNDTDANVTTTAFEIAQTQLTHEIVMSSETPLVGANISTLYYAGSYFQFNATQGVTTDLLNQRTDVYTLFNGTGQLFIDENKNNKEDADEGFTTVPYLSFALEGQRGGRLVAVASSDMFNSTLFTRRDNEIFLLNSLQWLVGTSYRLNVTSVNLNMKKYNLNETISVSASIDNGNGSVVPGIRVHVEVLVAQSEYQYVLMSSSNGMEFTASVLLYKPAVTQIRVEAAKRGYGFIQSLEYTIEVEAPAPSIGELSYYMVILFLLSLASVTYTTFVILRHKTSVSKKAQKTKE